MVLDCIARENREGMGVCIDSYHQARAHQWRAGGCPWQDDRLITLLTWLRRHFQAVHGLIQQAVRRPLDPRRAAVLAATVGAHGRCRNRLHLCKVRTYTADLTTLYRDKCDARHAETFGTIILVQEPMRTLKARYEALYSWH